MRLPEIDGPKRVEAEVFHEELSGGRHRAALLGARGSDNEIVQCVAKLPGMTTLGSWHPAPSLLEWFG